MATHPENEGPGFEHDVNELPDDAENESEDTLEDEAVDDDLEDAQAEAAKEREEDGGYQ